MIARKLKQPPRAEPAQRLSPARQAYVAAIAEVDTLHAEMVATSRGIVSATEAAIAVTTAEEALKTAVFEALLSSEGEFSDTDRFRLVGAVTEARSVAASATDDESAYHALAARHAAVTQAVEPARNALVWEEAQRLGAAFRAHAVAALQAKAGLESLRSWSLGQDTTLDIGSLLKLHPDSTSLDPGAFHRSVVATERSVSDFAEPWTTLPRRLAGDPDASAPLPSVTHVG